MEGFKPALNSKGLRRNDDLACTPSISFKPALNSKGLRQNDMHKILSNLELQASPEFKGIKTCHPFNAWAYVASSQP